jgi:hypothetical protein
MQLVGTLDADRTAGTRTEFGQKVGQLTPSVAKTSSVKE